MVLRQRGGALWEPVFWSWIVWIFTLHLVASLHPAASEKQFTFTQEYYNATIYENSVGKTFIMPTKKMGIFVKDDNLEVSYSIVERNDKKIFKAEEYLVEDFWFLRVRTHTGIYVGQLNREHTDHYELTVRASGHHSSGQVFEAETKIFIQILDTNDLSPIFLNPIYNVTINEDLPLHSTIVQVSASDADVGINAEIYYNFVQHNRIFAIHPTTGVVTLTRPLNFLEEHEYEFEILASDRGPKAEQQDFAQGKAKLFIFVQQVNLYAPEISVENLPSLIEHGSVGTVYAILIIEDKDIGINGKIKLPKIISGDPKDYFMLQQGKQGEYRIVVREKLDRENSPDGYNLTIFAADRGTPSKNVTFTVPVDIQDTNDNFPVFSESVYDAVIDETALIGTPVTFVKAGDADVGNNAKMYYSITGGNVEYLFQIDPYSGLIRTAAVLDAEQMDTVELEVSAEDEANSGIRKSGQAKVVITIRDFNDNAPLFNITSKILYVDENSPVGTEVGRINASDADSEENGYFSLTIANVNPVPFEIKPFTGLLMTTEVLDFESMRETYLLKIRASDWGVPFRRESEITISVKVRDVNDNPPRFEQTACVIYLSKEAPVNTRLIVVSAIDFDIGNIVTYEINDGNVNDFYLDPETGSLKLNSSPDDLKMDHYTLSITAKDGVNVVMPMTVTVSLVDRSRDYKLINNVRSTCQDTNVTKVLRNLLQEKDKSNKDNLDLMSDIPELYLHNKHAPVFNSEMVDKREIPEDSPVGSVILQLPVHDEDPGYNGMLVYVISAGNERGTFHIDNGVLVVLSKLDRESIVEYDLTITVADLGIPSFTIQRNITVIILDANDCKPQFEHNFYSVNVSETVLVNATITQVYALDDDEGNNANIVYSIISDTDDFSIDPQSGIIKVNRILDRETQEIYHLLVEAKDGGEKISLSSTTTVTILVIDVNDNMPKFVPDLYDIKIREDLPIGAVVTTLTAYDPDLDEGGQVFYNLTYGMDDKFEIDELTGTIRITKPLDFETKQVYNISAQAEDKGVSPLISSCFVNIEVIDVNENLHPPVFDNFVAMGSVQEGEPIGTAVMQVYATDEENDTVITYSIRDGSGLGRFIIDSNGTIFTSQILDRETVSHYWLTVYAQDNGLVPLYSRQEVLIRVSNINDNIPQTVEPLYNCSVIENSPAGTFVIQVQAYDSDKRLEQNLTFEITGGNPQGFFSINRKSGIISTTERNLDREAVNEHVLEVTVSDNGTPNLSSVSRVVVHVTDENDHSPMFINSPYRLQVPEGPKGSALFRVMAKDIDIGRNADIIYSIKRRRQHHFNIDPIIGVISCQEDLKAGEDFNFVVKATDNGRPSRKASVKVKMKVAPKPTKSHYSPAFDKQGQQVEVMENDEIGHLITIMQAFDKDGDKLWYAITDGNNGHKFSIGPEDGIIFVVRKLDWEMQKNYNLTIQATDGVHQTYSWVQINVIDSNDNPPVFSQKQYFGQVFENANVGKEILAVSASDQDEGRLFYTIYSAANAASKRKFYINSETGGLKVNEKLDREVLARHELVVMVRDQGLPPKRSMARVIISVLDNNDHYPEFLSYTFEGRVFETAAIGTSVLQVVAIDGDRGENAEVHYSIISGNAGSAFAIDEMMGIISVAKELDREGHPDYELAVIAADRGLPMLTSTATVRIFVTISNNAPPKFAKDEYMAELPENEPVGTIVTTVYADSRSSVVYKIIGENISSVFMLNPNSGVLSTNSVFDYEQQPFYNLTVLATNIMGRSALTSVLVHIIDKNDNHPVFEQESHKGVIIESAPIGSVVLSEFKSPLVVRAIDNDTGSNAGLRYEIIESQAKHVFSLDPSTGAIRTASLLDHELVSRYEFIVQVSDMGKPRLWAESPAKVSLHVLDVNDSPPMFSQSHYNVTLLLPTYKEVAIVTVTATDPDSEVASKLFYKITGGNEDEQFSIDEISGEITITDEDPKRDAYYLSVSVNDGTFVSFSEVLINVERTDKSSMMFARSEYNVDIQENEANNQTLVVLPVTGLALNEHVIFSIINHNAMFMIGKTSGVVHGIGVPFDREKKNSYKLIVEARDSSVHPRIAHTLVYVNITDVNDNVPMFFNQPYNSVVPVDAEVGYVLKQVSAVDQDTGMNGEILFNIITGCDRKFTINKTSGEIKVLKSLAGDENKECTLLIEAADQGVPSLRAKAKVPIKVITKATPLFQHQFYRVSIPENIELHCPILSLQAASPKGQKLIYSITHGDLYGEFTVDFNTGVISVVDNLDYEKFHQYNLTVRATDVITGTFTEAVVNINLEDVNDKTPTFLSEEYIVVVSEAVLFGTAILQVHAKDDDTGINQILMYSIQASPNHDDDTQYFRIDSQNGVITTKSALDHEDKPVYHILAVVTDNGIPALSSSVLVRIKVLDLNDNPPVFDQLSYNCIISDQATRGQFVTKVLASDPDSSDDGSLIYSIVDGNNQLAFSIDTSGIISLSNHRQPSLLPLYILNVSATDGVFTSFARIQVTVRSSNKYQPVFSDNIYTVKFPENYGVEMLVAMVTATDSDIGYYSMVSYSIVCGIMQKAFRIDADTGAIYSLRVFDREEQDVYSISVAATDNGGQMGFAVVKVLITDQNDNLPQFLAQEYKANIYFNATLNTSVIQIKATDEDEGPNGQVMYSLYPEDTNVTDLFTVDPFSGIVSIKGNLLDSANQVFQFFVTAADNGSLPLKNYVPVEIMVLGPKDIPPRFDRNVPDHLMVYFIMEDYTVGKDISRVTIVGTEKVDYKIVSGFTRSSNSQATFSVSADGRIQVMKPLDREQEHTYIFTVQALTQTSPPLLDNMEIHVHVLDANDNEPLFNSDPYVVTVAENSNPGMMIVQVAAADDDQSENGEVNYSFSPEMLAFEDLFTIDSQSGKITLLSSLDREAQSEYNLTVVATDSGKKVSHTSTTSVIIKVADDNDEAPVFEQTMYVTAVNEDAFVDTVLLTVRAFDKDYGRNKELSYHITDGDHLGQFNIRNTGEIYVNKMLDRETIAHYRLEITATDGKFISTATVKIDILDANDNSPVCNETFVPIIINEDEPPSTFLKLFRAADGDERKTRNAQIEYYLQGNGSEKFNMGVHTGVLTINDYLDRESTPEYRLVMHAVDGGGKSCTTDVLVVIKDINDNAPKFTLSTYRLAVLENSQINTLITRLSASDKDVGQNRHVKFRLKNLEDDFVAVDPVSGIVSLTKPLDREAKSSYNVSIVAYDQGFPQLSSTAVLTIVILDVNDNPPEFEHTTYMSSVSEDSPVGAIVLSVLATSKDDGINAEITYTLVAGNEHGKFYVDPKIGTLSVAESLDHEVAKEYFLTIQATDGGTPPLSNTAVAVINVTDVNDSPPVFSQSFYITQVFENAPVGSSIIQVIAVDVDSLPNARKTYSIKIGDIADQFVMDEFNGVLRVKSSLDREEISSYILVVQARDSGQPQLTGTTTISISVQDINDNPPVFTQLNYTATVQKNDLVEDRQMGFSILKFSVTDRDLEPNGPPFSFDIIIGQGKDQFRVDNNGVLSTTQRLNQKIKDHYELIVRVFDNGSPRLYSDTKVLITVTEESTFPPEVYNLEVSVNSYQDRFPGGIIGKVKAIDTDRHDVLKYKIASPNNHLFYIHEKDGRIVAHPGLDAGEYIINVSVTDGKYTSYGEVTVDVSVITESMVSNAVTIRLANLALERFLKYYSREFLKVLKSELSVRTRDIEIISVQPSDISAVTSARERRSASRNLDVLFAVRKSPNSYFRSNSLRRKVNNAVSKIEAALNVDVIKVFSDFCEKDTCEPGLKCVGFVEVDKKNPVVTEIGGRSFVTLKHQYTYQCLCKEGLCPEPSVPCVSDPCPSYKVCKAYPNVGHRCVCPEGMTGTFCEKLDLPDCTDASCSIKANKPMTFSGNSFACWTLADGIGFEQRLSVSLRIKTRQTDAILMFARGEFDYSILELYKGMLQYRFECGSGEGFVQLPKPISDGEWHSIFVERKGNVAEITLDKNFTAWTTAPGKNDALNLDTNNIYFGAEVETFPNGYRDVRKGFEGCMENIRIHNIQLPFRDGNAVAKSQEFLKVEFHCRDITTDFPGNLCAGFPCMNGGHCIVSSHGGYRCNCMIRFKGKKCEIDTNPCADSPCLNGGTCKNDPALPNDFWCKCSAGLKGRRCEYGKYCSSSPCLNGGTCVESPKGALCNCISQYEGPHCEFKANLCSNNPCKNGGTCYSSAGIYYCNCTMDARGQQCEEILLPKISSNSAGISHEEIYYIVGAVAAALIIVIILVIVRVWYRNKRGRRHNNISSGIARCQDNVIHNSAHDDLKHSKLSNSNITLSVTNIRSPSPQPPPVPNRPASYTPSNHDSLNALNNFDTVRNYGSAADELENIHNIPVYTSEFLQTFSAHPRNGASIPPSLPPPPPSNPASDTDSIQKMSWEFDYPNIMEHYPEAEKKNSENAKAMPTTNSPLLRQMLNVRDTTSFSSLPISESDDDLPVKRGKRKGYHWDASDWAPHPTLPNISEVPVREIPDSPSSSPQSNDSNTHVDTANMDDVNDTEMDDPDYMENDSEYVGDSEYAENEYDLDDNEDPNIDFRNPPNFHHFLGLPPYREDNYELPQQNLHIHPNHYLPNYGNERNDGLDNWPAPPVENGNGHHSDEEENVVRFRIPRPLRRVAADGSEYEHSAASMIDDMSVSVGGYTSTNASCSDISGLCDIEDSEMNVSDDSGDEKHSTKFPSAHLHTQV